MCACSVDDIAVVDRAIGMSCTDSSTPLPSSCVSNKNRNKGKLTTV